MDAADFLGKQVLGGQFTRGCAGGSGTRKSGTGQSEAGLPRGPTGSVERTRPPLPPPSSGPGGGSSPPLTPCWLQAVQGVKAPKRGSCALARCPEGARNRGSSGWSLDPSGGAIRAPGKQQGRAAFPRKGRQRAALRRLLAGNLGREDLAACGGDGFRGAVSPHSSQALSGKERPCSPRLGTGSGSQQGGRPLGRLGQKPRGAISPRKPFAAPSAYT